MIDLDKIEAIKQRLKAQCAGFVAAADAEILELVAHYL